MVDNPADVQLTFAAGARGYLLKEAAASELTEAVRKVARGEDYLQPSLGVAIARWREMPPRPHVSAIEQLTEREREVLRLIALGHTNAAIASIMYVSVRTVESRRSRIMQKLNLQTRADLVRYAADAGLTPKG
jgi:DNA-binding NarL/FixJ family response regulator